MGPSRNIALFIDGTWNEPSPNEATNVRKLFERCVFSSSGTSPQVTYYLPGVGTDIKQSVPGLPVGLFGPELASRADLSGEMPYVLTVARSLIGGGFGLGTKARIKEAYAYLCTQFVRRRGDKVFLFGFSRGAFAARSLAGFVSRVGTLLASKLHLVEAAYAVYEDGVDAEDTLLSAFLERFASAKMIRSIEDDEALPIHFLGVWDTVGALGLPWRLRKFTARHTEHHQVDVPPTVMYARHALALHELRSLFAPLVWTRGRHPQLEQVWFPGAHADVGGGYDPSVSGLADIALRWMAEEASGHGLLLEETFGSTSGVTAAKVLHHEIRKWFLLATPVVRSPVKDLLLAADTGRADSACALHFHRSVADHLQSGGRRQHEFWRRGINDALAEVDQTALRLYIAARLLGRQPRGTP